MVDFKNTILIMTSNVGATKINKKNHQVLGFGTNKDKEEETKDQYDKMKEKRRDMGNDLYLAAFILLIKFSHASIKTK